jgi:hypothetical protein
MQIEILVAAVAAVLLLCAFLILIRSVAVESRRESGPAPDVLATTGELNATRYRPMVRLLDPQEVAFIERLPGYHPSIGRRLRMERRRVMLTYLSMMKADFDAAFRQATEMLANAPTDQGVFTEVLLRERWRFVFSYWRIRASVALRLTGETPAVVRQLLASMESVEHCLQSVSARTL